MIDNTRGCITEHCTYRVCITGHPSKVTNLHGTPGLSAFRLSDTHHWYHTYTLHDAWASLPIVNRGSPRFSHALPAPQHASPSVSQRACALASRTVARFSDDLMDRSLTDLASAHCRRRRADVNARPVAPLTRNSGGALRRSTHCSDKQETLTKSTCKLEPKLSL